MRKIKLLVLLLLLIPALSIAKETKKATVFNIYTGIRKVVEVGDQNAFRGDYVLETKNQDLISYWQNKIDKGLSQEELYKVPEIYWQEVTPKIIQLISREGELGSSEQKFITCKGKSCDKYLKAEAPLGFSVVSNYKTTLSRSISSTASTIYVSSLTTKDSHVLTMADLGSKVFLTVEPGSNKEEIVMAEGIGTLSWTSVTRGLSFSGTSTAAVTANQKTHSAGAAIVMSNVHYVYDELVDKETADTISGVKTFNSLPKIGTYTAPTADEEFAPKKYVDDTTLSGAPDATETVKGNIELAGPGDFVTGNNTGDTSAKMGLYSLYSSTDNYTTVDQLYNEVNYSTATSTGLTTQPGQTFQISGAGAAALRKVGVYMYYGAGTAGDLVLDVYATSGGLPTGASLGTATTTAESTGYPKWFMFRFGSNVTLSAATTYAFTIKSPASSATNTYRVGLDSSSPTYSNGNFIVSTNSGTSFTAISGSDMIFATFYNVNQQYNKIPVTDQDGKLDQSFLDLTEDYTWSGDNTNSGTETHSGANTFTATTTFNGLIINGINSNNATTTGEAINGITTPQPVAIATTTGLIYKADANDVSKTNFYGFINQSYSSGETPVVITSGILAGFTGLTPGTNYYVSDTVGTISTTPGTTIIPIGTAITATKLVISRGKKVATASVSHTAADGANDDEIVTVGFRPTVIVGYYELEYDVAGTAYPSKGTATWKDGVLVSAITVTGTRDGTAITGLTIDNHITFTPVAPTDGVGNYSTLSIPTIANDGFISRVNNTDSGTNNQSVAATVNYIIYE
jgi:hypothetical protein